VVAPPFFLVLDYESASERPRIFRQDGDGMRKKDGRLIGSGSSPLKGGIMSNNGNRSQLARQIYREALEAGERAMKEAKPTPMIVSEADGLSDRPKAGGKSWYVPSGVCGFAWVKIRGNSWFIRALKKLGLAEADRNNWESRARFFKDGYSGGYSFSVREGGQSMELKEAYARAFANVLESYGVYAYASSRMD